MVMGEVGKASRCQEEEESFRLLYRNNVRKNTQNAKKPCMMF